MFAGSFSSETNPQETNVNQIDFVRRSTSDLQATKESKEPNKSCDIRDLFMAAARKEDKESGSSGSNQMDLAISSNIIEIDSD